MGINDSGVLTVVSNITNSGGIFGNSVVSAGSVDFGQNNPVGASFRCRMSSSFDQNVNVSGFLSCKMTSVANNGTDYIGVQINTSQGSSYTD